MIARLVRQYDTLKRCKQRVPDPYFAELPVWAEIILKSTGAVDVRWLGKPPEGKRSGKEEPCMDLDCPVTEKSACRSSGDESPHGLVDNAMWIFGKFMAGKARQKPQRSQQKKSRGGERKRKLPSDEARRRAYLSQMKAFYDHDSSSLPEIKAIYDCLSCDARRDPIWARLEKMLKEKLVDGKGNPIFEKDQQRWQDVASKACVRWVVETVGSSGKPVNSLNHIKAAWKTFQEAKNEWAITSLVDGQPCAARVRHPKIRGASLVSFNNAATYCGHLSPQYRMKSGNEDEEGGGSALPAQIGFEEAEKYAKALAWLIENSSVRFGDSVHCIWIDQSGSGECDLDGSGHEFLRSHGQSSTFTRGAAKGDKGQVLADTGDLLKALQRFRNGQKAGYRDKRFYLLSLLLRRKGRHAILGTHAGTMGLLDDNTNHFVERTQILIPSGYLSKLDDAREFCPTLMDVLSAGGITSEKKQRLVWDREVVEVIVAGHPLPADLCRLVVRKAIEDKHLEQSRTKRVDYLTLLAVAAGCARHYLIGTMGKESYGMGLDTGITDPGYLAGRLFALCENVQKRGRGWGPTLSDKLFSSAIDLPRQTLVQLYRNCLCYKDRIHKETADWFNEIFEKITLEEGSVERGVVMPENTVDEFAFLLGYWHQRGKFGLTERASSNDENTELPSNQSD